MPSLRLGSRRARDYGDLIDLFPASAFASPRRSTVPLLDYFRMPGQRLNELGDAIGVKLSQPAQLAFEYAVPVQRGRGKASFTDLMISAADTSAAVQAKFTEPIYQNVRSWLGEEANENRNQVLRGWLDLIQRETNCTFELDRISSLPYQVIHRTASVCFMPGPVRTVTYLLFGADHGDRYMKDLAALSQVLGHQSAIRFHVLECDVVKLPLFTDLENRRKNKEPEIGEAVKAALKSGPLFRFDGLNPFRLR